MKRTQYYVSSAGMGVNQGRKEKSKAYEQEMRDRPWLNTCNMYLFDLQLALAVGTCSCSCSCSCNGWLVADIVYPFIHSIIHSFIETVLQVCRCVPVWISLCVPLCELCPCLSVRVLEKKRDKKLLCFPKGQRAAVQKAELKRTMGPLITNCVCVCAC